MIELFEKGANPTKKVIKQVIDDLINRVKEGEADALQVLTSFKHIEKVIGDKRIKEEILPLALDQFNLQKDGKVMNLANFKIEEVEAGTKYTYSNDPIWSLIKEEADEILARLKEREAILKATREGTEELNLATGEMFRRMPAIKASSQTLKFTMIK